jgi:hypothetical protein
MTQAASKEDVANRGGTRQGELLANDYINGCREERKYAEVAVMQVIYKGTNISEAFNDAAENFAQDGKTALADIMHIVAEQNTKEKQDLMTEFYNNVGTGSRYANDRSPVFTQLSELREQLLELRNLQLIPSAEDTWAHSTTSLLIQADMYTLVGTAGDVLYRQAEAANAGQH